MDNLVTGRKACSLSVGIVVYQSDLAALKRCLLALCAALDCAEREFSEGLKVSVYLLDNSQCAAYSQALTLLLPEVEQWLPAGCQLCHRLLPHNHGYGAANNVLLHEVDTTYHLVLNPDVYLDPDALVVGLGYLGAHSTVALLSPKVDDEHVVKRYPDCLTLLLRYVNLPWLQRLFSQRLSRYAREDLTGEAYLQGAVAGGCFMLMPTAAWKAVDGFDERFFLYFEDFDLSLRLAQQGQLAYVPAVHLRHDGGGVGRKGFKHHRYFVSSAIKFFNKYGWRFV